MEGLSVVNMGGFKTELLNRLHEEFDCYIRFHPFIMACYLNINFKGRIVLPELLSESKEVLIADMCEAAVAFGDYTLPPADTTPKVVETVIEDSQPPIDDFDFLVTQLSQAERTPQPVTNADSANTPIEAWKTYIKGKCWRKLHFGNQKLNKEEERWIMLSGGLC